MALSTLVICFILLPILTEALTELVIKSEIFKGPRDWIKSWGSWFDTLFSCGYCFSVWVAFGVVFITQLSYNLTGYVWLDFVISALLIHRLSNVFHNIIDKWTDKHYDIRYINSEHGFEEEV
jgi:hypothetical protein